jgi:drug/metabolite transporter (DMT)-like permease
MSGAHDRPLLRGTLIALASATAFGLTTPLIARFGHGVGPFMTAALLYSGASIAAFSMRTVSAKSGRSLRAASIPRLIAIAAFGAALAPALLAWGIERAGPTSSSLALNLEAPATVALAALFYAEPIGRRVALAMLCMIVGGALVGIDVAETPLFRPAGTLAVAGAAAAWAVDNTLTRGMAEDDPFDLVAAKGGIGACFTLLAASFTHELHATLVQALALFLCGATGYGLSLRLYLLAQRKIGSARTGSVFAVGPFIGAAAAWGLGDRAAGLLTALGAVTFMVGVLLHLSEKHGHKHRHVAMEHEHAHRHDDGHHAHGHDPVVAGEHTHPHRHEPTEHEHPHAPDIHHTHTH